MDQREDKVRRRLAAGRELAASLAGLDRQSAEDQVVKHGYCPELILPTVEALTADLNSHRIRLFIDERDVVIRATAG
jgi:hypothetical protein